MKKKDVILGALYQAKISKKLTLVRIVEEHPHGGWFGENLKTKRRVHLRTAGRLHHRVPEHCSEHPDTKGSVDCLECRKRLQTYNRELGKRMGFNGS